jgi:hypothetical protein
MKKTLFALGLMAVVGLGGLVYESTSAAQNTNSSTTSMGNMNMGSKSNMGRRHVRHGRRHGRRHRRGRRR